MRHSVIFSDDYFTTGDPAHILGFQPPGHRVVIAETDVFRVHGPKINAYFNRHEIEPEILFVSLAPTENTSERAVSLLRELQHCKVPRRTEPVILIGGDALMDMGSFAAAWADGGRPFVRVCTSGQMWDCAIFGPSMSDHGLTDVGNYHDDVVSLLDRTFLATLPADLIRDGVAQQVKVAVTKDPKLFDLLESYANALIRDKFQGSTPKLDRLADTAVRATIGGAMADDDAGGMTLFGHTWSAALRDATREGPIPLRHGEAMSIDMALSAVLSWKLGLLPEGDRDRVLNLMAAIDLPTQHPLLVASTVVERANDTARRSRGSLAVPLLPAIGQCQLVRDVPPLQVREAVQWLHNL